MKTKISFLLLMAVLLGCDFADVAVETDFETDFEMRAPNQVLMLTVDYTTNSFEGGTVLSFSTQTKNFTVTNRYVQPNDFGSVELTYEELGEKLFFGTIHWMGTGKMTFPEKLASPEVFKRVTTQDYVMPTHGFEDIFNPNDLELNYEKAWGAVQGLAITREFLKANPNQKVKMFLYTPSVGVGNPEDWFWVIYLKR
ncbi:MAG: hypothetical protein QM237_08475 [Bacteroidota bacterium]|jgi:hypothetical protein|nr:hypothetical protein [Bacteroidota bacterium]HHU97083.1 hypothetical protein [Petrimonas sp.]